MCGIWLYLSDHKTDAETDVKLYQAFNAIQRRGPDYSKWEKINGVHPIYLGFHRLAIRDLSTRGDQPFIYATPNHTVYVMTNGEIYNHKDLEAQFNLPVQSQSDCEVVGLLYLQGGIEAVVKNLEGEWACVIVDINHEDGQIITYAARDPFGVRPLFTISPQTADGKGWGFSSELKGLVSLGDRVQPFQPGYYQTLSLSKSGAVTSQLTQYYQYTYPTQSTLDPDGIKLHLRELLTQSVISRMQADRPVGCLLSGGIDSSLVSALAAQYLATKGQKLRTFSIGMPSSPDVYFAQMVADHIGSIHTVIPFNTDQAVLKIKEVIGVIESYDITSIRASVCQYILLQWIAEHTDIKVILSGEYADEVAGSYLYMHNAPSPEVFHAECVRLVKDIYLFDALRADRCIASNGIEARVPFAHKAFIEFYLSLDASSRMPRPSPLLGITGKVEKAWLREAFYGTGLLPDRVLTRIKNGLSDSISPDSKSWYQYIEEYVVTQVTDAEFQSHTYTHNPPVSKEAYFYRRTFEEIYGEQKAVTPYFWLPKWSGNVSNPSARVLSVFNKEDLSE
jgi:asparagine synthase (glutamine-hydrolysing)